MWQGFITLLADAPKPSENGFDKWRQLLPFLILIVFSVLSSILKGKQKKKTGQPTSKQGPDQRQGRAIPRPLPSYARRAQQSQQGQQVGQRQTEGQSASPGQTRTYGPTGLPADKSSYGPGGTGAPGSERSLRGPGKLRPQPSQMARQPISSATTSSYRSSAPPPLPTIRRSDRERAVKTQRGTTSLHKGSYGKPAKQAARALAGQLISDSQTAQRQMQGAREGAGAISSANASTTGAYAMDEAGRKRLQVALQNSNNLAQAIVLAEILGTPAGLKDKGSFDF